MRKRKKLTAKKGDHVEVYMNLHLSRPGEPVYSVRSRKTKKVLGHVDSVILTNVMFHVSEAGRQRVLREKRKNVHAVVDGYLWAWDVSCVHTTPSIRVRYNPYDGPYFSKVSYEDEHSRWVTQTTVAWISEEGVLVPSSPTWADPTYDLS